MDRFAFDGAPVQKDVELTLGPVSVTGAVYDADTLDPLGGGLLFLHFLDEGGDAWRIPTDPGGAYHIYGVPDPTYNLLLDVWVDGYHPAGIGIDYEGVLVEQDIPMNRVSPYFSVDPSRNNISGFDWEPFADIDITISDGVDTLKSLSATVEEWGAFFLWGHEGDLEGFEVEAGHVVTVEDVTAGVTKTHTVTELRDVAVDVDADTVSGFAEAGSEVTVEIYGGPWGGVVASRVVGADVPTGSWVADFSVEGPNPDEDPFDIEVGTEGAAVQADEDLDATYVAWSAEPAEAPNPRFSVDPVNNGIWGVEWPADAWLNVSVNADPIGFDVQTDEWGDFERWEEWPDFQAGDHVRVVFGADDIVKAHWIHFLTIDDVDVDANTVSGTAEADTEVTVEAFSWEGSSRRTVVADGDGVWTADFSVDGGGHWEHQFDIGPGAHISAQQFDDDGDATVVGLRVASPHFMVDHQQNGIWGHEWPSDTLLTILVGEDAEDPDYSTTTATDERGDFDLWIDEFEYDIASGELITVTDGDAVTKEHRVAPLLLTDVNPVDDVIYGEASPDAWVEVAPHAKDHPFPMRRVQADGDGLWVADFATPGDSGHAIEDEVYDIGFGEGGWAREQDYDGDSTQIQWSAEEVYVVVYPEYFDPTASGASTGLVQEQITVTAYTDDSSIAEEPEPLGSWTVDAGEPWTFLMPAGGEVFANQPFQIDVTIDPHLAGLGIHSDEIVVSIELAGEGSGDRALGAPSIALGDGNGEPEPIVRSIPVELEYTNAAPVAVDDTYSVQFGMQLTVPGLTGVLANDMDADGDELIAELESGVSSGALVLDPDGGFTYTPNDGFSGVDTFTYRATDGLAHSNVATVQITVQPEAVDPDPDPLPPVIRGNDRYATAIAGSVAAYPDGADFVVIATGEHFADALGGAALAGALDAPLLLTQRGALPSAVAAEIRRLEAAEVYILGGAGAVSADVFRAIDRLPLVTSVKRIAGNDRYQTATAVANETIKVLNANGGYSGDAFLATGANFSDALGASPVAASQGMPVFLADPARTSVSLPASVKRVWITGGTAVVSPQVQASLGTRYAGRLAGNDRFATAAAVARFGVGRGMAWNEVGITTGMNFPDALAAGPVLGSRDAVMLLTDANSVPAPTRSTLDTNRRAIEKVTFFGGDAAVPPGVRSTVNSIISRP